MLTRVISALVSIPLFLYIVIKGGILFKFSVLVVASIAIFEFFNAFKKLNFLPSKKIGLFSVFFLFVITLKSIDIDFIMLWFFISVLLVLCSSLFNKKFDIPSAAITIIGIQYIIFFMFHLIFIENLKDYHHLIWLVFITAWATDTFAYFTGYFIGKHKLCPSISPKKTIEGAIGGILGSILTCFVFSYYFAPIILMHSIVIGILGSILGQLGDLTASYFKRYTGVKDYGKIMPGHGGILDRFDSILFTAPAVYYYIILFIV